MNYSTRFGIALLAFVLASLLRVAVASAQITVPEGGGLVVPETGLPLSGGTLTGDLCLQDNVELQLGSACSVTTDSGLTWDGDSLNIDGVTEFLDDVGLISDSTTLAFGAAGSTDSEMGFDGTDFQLTCSGCTTGFTFNTAIVVGTIAVTEDSGAVSLIDMSVSATPVAGTEQSLAIAVDATTIVTAYAEADSSGSVEDAHLRQAFSPVLDPSADQALAADAAFDCDEGINRIVGSGGAVVLSATPSINDGDLDGQICYVQGTSANTVQINDNTNVQLAGGANFVMGQGDMLVLAWDAGDSDWYEISRSDN
jgi:hypothetical protein